MKRVFYVDVEHGDDTNTGTSQQRPFKTISKAAGVIRGGDKLIVRPGVYYEQPLFKDLGSSQEKPVWIVAAPRGTVTIAAVWKAAAVGEVAWRPAGNGIYSSPRSQPALFAWTADKHFLFRYMKLAHLRTGAVTFKSQHGTFRSGVAHVSSSGLACEGGRIYVKLPGGKDPNGTPLMFSRPSWGEAKPGTSANIIQIVNSPYVVVDGFRIQGTGTYGIACPGSPHTTVRNCIFEYCRESAGLVDDSLVEWCEYSYPGFYEFLEETRRRNNGQEAAFPLVTGPEGRTTEACTGRRKMA